MGIESNSVTLVQSSSLNQVNDFKTYNRKTSCLDFLSGGLTCYIIPM